MTVKELIDALGQFDPRLPVIADDHSEMGVVEFAELVEDHYDNGGYISFAYDKIQKEKCRQMVYISANREKRLADIPIPGHSYM